MGLKAELTIDPSYAIGARCLDTLIQDRRAAVEVASIAFKSGIGLAHDADRSD